MTLKWAREYLALAGWSIKGNKVDGYRIHRKGVRNDPWSYETTCLIDACDTADASNKHARPIVPV